MTDDPHSPGALHSWADFTEYKRANPNCACDYNDYAECLEGPTADCPTHGLKLRTAKEAHRRLTEKVENPFAAQVGGDHYRQYAIQPVEFIHANGIPYMEGSIIKYVVRHRSKNGRQDLEKARHFLDMLIEKEYGSEE